jgi:hypothetical protein
MPAAASWRIFDYATIGDVEVAVLVRGWTGLEQTLGRNTSRVHLCRMAEGGPADSPTPIPMFSGL